MGEVRPNQHSQKTHDAVDPSEENTDNSALDWTPAASGSYVRHRPDGIKLRVLWAPPNFCALATSAGGYAVSAPPCATLLSAQKHADRIGALLGAILTRLDGPERQPAAPPASRSAGTVAQAIEVPPFRELAAREPEARGAAVRQLRRQLRLTKKRVAQVAGVSIAALRRLENGSGQTRLTSIRLIVAALKEFARVNSDLAQAPRPGARRRVASSMRSQDSSMAAAVGRA